MKKKDLKRLIQIKKEGAIQLLVPNKSRKEKVISRKKSILPLTKINKQKAFKPRKEFKENNFKQSKNFQNTSQQKKGWFNLKTFIISLFVKLFGLGKIFKRYNTSQMVGNESKTNRLSNGRTSNFSINTKTSKFAILNKFKIYQIKPRKFIVIVFLLLFLCLCGGGVVFADDSSYTEEEIEQQLEDSIIEQIGSLDFEGLQDILDNLSSQSIDLFGSTSFWDKVNQLINGEFGEGYTSFLGAIASLFFEEIVGFIPLLATIVMVTLVCSIIGNLRSKEGENSVGQIIDFVCFGVVVVLVSAVVVGLLNSATAIMSSMQEQMNVLFPILLTFLAGVGGTVSVSIFQPAVAILSSVIVQVFMTVIVPLFVFLFIFIVINNFSPSVKLNKFISFITSVFKWIAGVCFSVFLGVLAIQGIVAGSFDSVSIRATRFAIKSYVPILGGYLSDGFNIVMASSVLIKNAVGVAGIILLFISILSPVITIIACSLLLKLTAAILEPISENSRIPEFLQQVAKTLNLLIMMILGVAFVYVITIGMILCTANVF